MYIFKKMYSYKEMKCCEKNKYFLHSAFSSEIVLSIVKDPAAPKFTSIQPLLVSHQLKEGKGSRCQNIFSEATMYGGLSGSNSAAKFRE